MAAIAGGAEIDLAVEVEVAPVEMALVELGGAQRELVERVVGQAARHRDRIFQPLRQPGTAGIGRRLAEQPLDPGQPAQRRQLDLGPIARLDLQRRVDEHGARRARAQRRLEPPPVGRPADHGLDEGAGLGIERRERGRVGRQQGVARDERLTVQVRPQQQVEHAQEMQPGLDRERGLAQIARPRGRRRPHALALDHHLERQGMGVVGRGGERRVRR